MRHLALALLLCSAVCLPALSAVDAPAVPGATTPTPAATQTYVGTIVSISGMDLSVAKLKTDATTSPDKQEFTLTPSTKITINGKDATRKKLVADQQVTVTYDANGAVQRRSHDQEEEEKVTLAAAVVRGENPGPRAVGTEIRDVR